MAQGVSWRAAPHSAVTTALPLGRATLILELLLIKELTTQFRHSKNAAAAPKQKGGRAGPPQGSTAGELGKKLTPESEPHNSCKCEKDEI